MTFVQIGEGGRIVAYADFDANPDPEVWLESPWDAIPDDFDDYRIEDGELVHDPRDLPPVPFMAEEVLAVMLQETDALDSLPDSALAHMAPYMAAWQEDVAYAIGDKVQYQERPYRCVQAHTSSQEWNPADAVSLWARILVPSPDVIPEWEQPDSTNPYMKGDKVTHNGHTWVSDIDYNVFEPGVYGWKEVNE